MSLKSEILTIRQELTRLQERLKVLESKLMEDPCNRIETRRESKVVAGSQRFCTPNGDKKPKLTSIHCNKSVGPAPTKDSRTIRSRSFKVMRHLINMVDLSQVDFTTTGKHSQPLESIKKPVKTKNERLKSQRTSVSTTDNPLSTKSPPSSDTVKTRVASKVATSQEIPRQSRLYELIKKNYCGLCLPTDNLLATNYGFEQTQWLTSAKKIEQRASKLIKRGLAGVWRWNHEMQAANYLSLKKRSMPVPKGIPCWQFSGWSTHDTPDCSPPSTHVLPKIVSDNLVQPTWFWHQDKWLLFSLHKT